VVNWQRQKHSFLADNWSGEPLIDSLHLTPHDIIHYPPFVKDYISNNHWLIPDDILTLYPDLRRLASKVVIPAEDCEDKLIWKHNPNGELSLKESYDFKRQIVTKVQWSEYIWCKDIPPSKSLLAWRLIHDKIPTDEKLAERGLHFPSMCSLCCQHIETTFHLFFECMFAYKLWCWLASILDFPLQFQYIPDIWTICERGWSPQSKITVQASIINIISTIWYNRNQCRFNDKKTNWRKPVNSIISAVALSGNNTSKASTSSIRDFILLKKFNIKIRPPKAPIIKEVIWSPPIIDWIKCNTDGSSNQSTSSCAGIFRNSDSIFITCFAENLGRGNAYFAKLSAVMRAIEIAHHRGWNKLWIETDSKLVVLASKNINLVPCELRNRWKNCLLTLQQMNFVITHIFREGNNCADKLASIGLSIQGLTVWLEVPDLIRSFYVNDRLGLPNFRFVNF
jgi:ribonuclease HI